MNTLYTYSDALQRCEQNILNYMDSFEEGSEEYKANEILLKQVRALPRISELASRLGTEIWYLRSDWPDLGWDSDGCPDGNLCNQFETRLVGVEITVNKLHALLPTPTH
jgi:hypothetical protein